MFWKLSFLTLLLAALGCMFSGCGGGSSSDSSVADTSATMVFNVRSTSGRLLSAAPKLKLILHYGPNRSVLAIRPIIASANGIDGSATIVLSGAATYPHVTSTDVYWLRYFIDENNDNQYQDSEPMEFVAEYGGSTRVLYYDPATSIHPGWNVYWWPQDNAYERPANGLIVNSRISIF